MLAASVALKTVFETSLKKDMFVFFWFTNLFRFFFKFIFISFSK